MFLRCAVCLWLRRLHACPAADNADTTSLAVHGSACDPRLSDWWWTHPERHQEAAAYCCRPVGWGPRPHPGRSDWRYQPERAPSPSWSWLTRPISGWVVSTVSPVMAWHCATRSAGHCFAVLPASRRSTCAAVSTVLDIRWTRFRYAHHQRVLTTADEMAELVGGLYPISPNPNSPNPISPNPISPNPILRRPGYRDLNPNPNPIRCHLVMD